MRLGNLVLRERCIIDVKYCSQILYSTFSSHFVLSICFDSNSGKYNFLSFSNLIFDIVLYIIVYSIQLIQQNLQIVRYTLCANTIYRRYVIETSRNLARLIPFHSLCKSFATPRLYNSRRIHSDICCFDKTKIRSVKFRRISDLSEPCTCVCVCVRG